MNVDLNVREEEGDLFYFYHNWISDQKNKIHKGTCKMCTFGTGRKLSNPTSRGENGVWIGPFSTLEICHKYIMQKLHLSIPENCLNCHKTTSK